MSEPDLRNRSTYLGVACVTCGTLVLELALTRIFSVVMYYHFAFMAISLALFGLGFAGIYLYLRPRLSEGARFGAAVSRYTLLAALASWGYLVYLLRQRIDLFNIESNIG